MKEPLTSEDVQTLVYCRQWSHKNVKVFSKDIPEGLLDLVSLTATTGFWEFLVRRTKLTPEFIDRHFHSLVSQNLVMFQTLPEELIRKHHKALFKYDVAWYQDMSDELYQELKALRHDVYGKVHSMPNIRHIGSMNDRLIFQESNGKIHFTFSVLPYNTCNTGGDYTEDQITYALAKAMDRSLCDFTPLDVEEYYQAVLYGLKYIREGKHGLRC